MNKAQSWNMIKGEGRKVRVAVETYGDGEVVVSAAVLHNGGRKDMKRAIRSAAGFLLGKVDFLSRD